MLKLSHLLMRAIHCCSPARCKEFLRPLSLTCQHLEDYGVSVFTPVHAALKKKVFYSAPVLFS